MRSHITWCLVVALNVLVTGTKLPRQIVYQIRPAPLSAFTSQDGTFLLDDGVTQVHFPSFGLKTGAESRTVKAIAPPPSNIPVVTSLTSASNDSADVDSSSASSSSGALSDENYSSAVTKEEITEVPRFGSSQMKQQFLTLQPEQFQQIFGQLPPQQFQQQPVPTVDVGPRYEFKSIEEANSNSEDIKTAQTEVITEDRLQPAYSERREKRRRKDSNNNKEPPGDASYAFGYETDEAARHEVADPDGNVKGWYTYVDDEGTVRKIIYTAGAGKGFVILGKEKVRGPGGTSPPQQRKQKASSRKGNSDYGYSADSSTYSSVRNQKAASTPPSLQNYFNNWNDLAKAGTSNPPVPTSLIQTAEQPARTKKPVFIVKIKRPVKKEQQFFTKPVLSDPEPLPVPVTPFKSRTRRRPMTLSDVVPSLRKSRIKKYPTPPIYYADDDRDDESGYDASSNSGQASASSSSSASSSAEDSEDSNERGAGGNYGGGGGLVKGDPDSSYVFGYETDQSNRLEKSDPYGNVRGSYSYIGGSLNQLLSRHSHSPSASMPHRHIYDEPKKLKLRTQRKGSKKYLKSIVDPDGVKRTVHYIAGGNTGFQVIHASPSISRGVRLEAPPGYVVKRVPSLRTSESRYPIPITVPQPSAIVYHIHPDGGWKPWEPTLRKKKVKIHRKKLPKSFFENAQRDGIVLLQTQPDNTPVSRSANVAINSMGSVGSGSTNTYFREKITAAGSGMVTARETQYPSIPISAPVSRRRHAPQRGYTADHHIVQIDDSDSREHTHSSRPYLSPQKSSKSSSSPSNSEASTQSAATVQAVHEREPLLYSPTFETVRDSSRMPIPNPIQLQPTQVAIKNRGAPTASSTGSQPGLDTSSSNHHAVAFTSDGKLQVDVPTVVIEAIEANSQSTQLTTVRKDENKNAAPHNTIIHHRLPEAAALTQNTPPPPPPQRPQQITVTKSSSSSNPNTIITVIQPTTRPNYEISSASASSAGYKYHHNQNHHYKAHPVTIPTPPPTPVQSKPTPTVITVHKQQPSQPYVNQLQGGNAPVSPTPPPSRSRRRHHRSKTQITVTTPAPATPSSPSNSASINSSNAIRSSGGEGHTETTTSMSSSKRLINRLSASDQDLAVSA